MRRILLALVPLVLAFLVEWALPSLINPYHWFIFYPAAFLTSWIGGRRVGVLSTLATTVVVWFAFIEPEYAIAKAPHELLPAGVFGMMGIFFAVFHDRLRTANASLQKLADERRVFSALVDNSSDFIGIADASGTPIYVNPAGRKMVGLAQDADVKKTKIPDYYPAEQRAFVEDVIVKNMVERGHWQGETRFRNFETNASIPVSDEHFIIREPESGRVLGMGTVTRDITEIKRARDDIEAANQKLKELDERKSRFYANVSHELRTPLALILGPVRVMLESPNLPAEERAELEIVERNARTLLQHVNDLLDLAKALAGAMDVDYAETDVAELVRFVAGHFESMARESELVWIVEAAESLGAEVDAEKLRRVLYNLVSNACKFTPHGGRVRVTLRAAGDERFAIEVADSGPGIPEDKRETVFERFRQLEEAPTRRFGGTGLGLAIARELVTLLRGRISVGAAPEGGALFLVEIPRKAPAGASVRHELAERSSMELPVATPSDIAVTPKAPPGAPLVLLVEDNPEMRHYVSRGLGDRYRVVTAADGREGLDKTLELRPDLVLTDLMMPGVSGETLVRELRGRPELRDLPIVVLTAKAEDEVRVRLLEQGVTDYLVKPFAIEELRARVSNIVSKRLAEERLREAREALERALRARDEVLGIVAHDLRNPLNAIVLQSTLMRRRGSPERRDTAPVDAIRRAATRMNRLIQDLLDVARLEAGRALSIDRGAVSCSALVRDVIEAHQASAEAASVELVAEVTDGAEMFADRMRLLQVFDNLVGNALKFTPAHGRVAISLQPKDGEIVFCVADNGKGMPKEAISHLFDRFWQADTRDRRGAGLGLSVTKAIVEEHGGRIWAESAPGEGTRVYFTMPKVAASAVAV